MPVFDLFSKRMKRQEQGSIEVFTYDDVPQSLRVQVLHILADAFGERQGYMSQTDDIWKSIHEILCREYGRFSLGQARETDSRAVSNYFLQTSDVNIALDFIELAFEHVSLFGNHPQFKHQSNPRITPAAAVEELNERFLENSVGFEFFSGQLVRRDNEVSHKQIVLPALVLLHEKNFAGANEEYLSAHQHYRLGKNKECLNDCLKAFESTMKTICKLKGWPFSEQDTAKTLIDTCFRNQLIPSFLQSEIGSLRTVLEAGIPTLRNKLSGHGQGEAPRDVPEYYASYAINLTAATIIFLVKAAQEA